MSRPNNRLTSLERWEMAVLLIEEYGDDVGNFVMEQTRACFDSNDDEGTMFWFDITDKVQMLWGPCEGDTIN